MNNTANPVSERYSYEYDALNRITAAFDNTNNYTLSNVEYDVNGNITKLARRGVVNEDPYSFNSMENLTYNYDSGNKLLRIDEVNTKLFGFKSVAAGTANQYDYDANGNLTKDLNKNIGANGITYNHLNLPTQVTINSDNISYIYDATGIKLKKTVSTGGSTEYAGSYIYENGDLQFMNHPEGYVTPDGNGGYDSVYQYKDHLGNIRLTYADANNNGQVDVTSDPMTTEIIEENNYYPFGGLHSGYNGGVSPLANSVAQKYKYNGKELQDALGYNVYDYQARHYDPWIGRWLQIDPLADIDHSISMTPYHYAANNPIVFVDPDGQDWFYYRADGDDEARYHWQEGSEYEHTYSYTDDNGDQQTETIGLTGVSSFVGEDQNGDFFNFGDDGKVSSIDASSISEGTDIVNVRSTWETVPGSEENSSRSAEGATAQLGTAVIISQGDSPAPGPADILALGVLYNLLHGLITGDGVESSMQTLHFAKDADEGESAGAEHTKGKRNSTKGKHERGRARKARDRGGEKGDTGRRYPRKRPPGWKGPWPPKK